MPTMNACRITREERCAAYHEAGHAVARYRLPRAGGGRSVWIDGAGSPKHRPACDRPRLMLRLAEALDRIQVCLAGSIAERRATGRAERSAREIDWALAAETALRVSFQPETDAMLGWLSVRTEHLVEFYWSDVDAVARALLERRSLTAREIEATIRTERTGRQAPATARGSTAARGRSGHGLHRRHGSDASPSASVRGGPVASA